MISQTSKYGYDAAGNTLTYLTITATYNKRGRMVTLKKGTSTASYIYNALGQRVQQSGGGPGTVLYMYDEAGHLLGEYTSTGVLVQETIWLGDIPVATIRPKTGGVDIFYVHTDHLNTPRKVSRPSDNKLRWTWDPDPYGTTAPANNPASLGAFTYNLRFPGQLADSQAGFNQNYFRDYDPAIGRYVQSDPIGLRGGPSTYAYVRNDPVELSDPRGLAPSGYGISLMEWLQDISDVSHPCLVAAAAARSAAFTDAESSGLPGPSSGPQDALRHCIGSCKLAALAGESCAKIIGDNHEAANLASGQPIEDSEMDWNNNGVGRAAAKCEPGKPCKNKCRERLQNCQLFGRGGKHLCYPPR